MANTRQAPKDTRRRPDDEEDDRRRSRDEDEDDEGPMKPRKKRKSAAGPVRKVLYAVGGLAGAIGLFILLFWIYSPVGADSSMLCYFPPETVSIIGYDNEELAKNSKTAEIHTQITNLYKRFSENRFPQATGVAMTDVEKYLSGVAAGKPEEEDKITDRQEKRGTITVIKFLKSFDQDKFIGGIGSKYVHREMTSRDGKKYHQLQERTGAGELTEDVSFFFPNSRTLVYATTRREIEEALGRVSGRISLAGDMRDIADRVDGHFFRARAIPEVAPTGQNQVAASAFTLGIVDKDAQTAAGVQVGNADWFASNGNDFLYGECKLFSDVNTAKSVRSGIAASFDKAKVQIYASENGSALADDPFNPKPKAGAPPTPGMSTGGTETKDVLAALNEYIKTGKVYRKGRAVIIEGTISHGTPEQGTFEKFWKVVGPKVIPRPQGGGFPGMPGMMGPGMMGGMMPPGQQ